MGNTIIYERLQELIQIYIYSEQQYINASVNSNYPILQTFFEERAWERTNFIEEVQFKIEGDGRNPDIGKTLDELYAWHIDLYGKSSLFNWPVADLEIFLADEKALDICNFLLETELPSDLRPTIRKQTVKLGSCLLSLAYLKIFYHN